MKPPLTPTRAAALVAAFFLAQAAPGLAQSSSTTNPPTDETDAADQNPNPAADTDDGVVTLDPFTVNTSEGQQSYQVNETLAGSRVRTNLRDVGSAIDRKSVV